MLTLRIEHVPGIIDDDEVLQAVRDICGPRPRSLAWLKRIGLVGPDGRIYRLILAQDAVEYQALLTCLAGLGFRTVPPSAGMDAKLRR